MKPSAYPTPDSALTTPDFMHTLHCGIHVYLIAFHQLSKMTIILVFPLRINIPFHPCDFEDFQHLFRHVGTTVVVFFSAVYLNDIMYHLATSNNRIKGTLRRSYTGYT